jgi:hypothetical protein
MILPCSSPFNKTLLNVVFDQSISGIFYLVLPTRAGLPQQHMPITDKLIKTHCLPLDRALKRSSPCCVLEETNRAILHTYLNFYEYFRSLASV